MVSSLELVETSRFMRRYFLASAHVLATVQKGAILFHLLNMSCISLSKMTVLFCGFLIFYWRLSGKKSVLRQRERNDI